MAAWAVRQYWNKCSQTGQKELVQRQVSSFTFFFAKSKTSKMDFALPKKASLPNGPKSINLMEKTWKTSMYSMWYFWAIFGRDFPGDSRYSTIHLLQRKVPQPDSCNFRWVDDLVSPLQKCTNKCAGKTKKKPLKQKRVEVFECLQINTFLWATSSEARFIKLLKLMMKTCTQPGETNISDRGKKKASSWEVPTR